MTDLAVPRPTAPLHVPSRGTLARLLVHPAGAFAALSLAFGTLLIVLTPPLRGPDEAAHFLRAYGISQGEIVPRTFDQDGRKGIHLPAYLHDGFAHFEATQARERKAFGAPVGGYARVPDAGADLGRERAPVFVRYEGSEGYAPVAYLPHAAAALAARLAQLDFASTLILMRFAGLAAMTAALAYGIALVPYLAWTFLAVAMLPAALYGRAMINADGGALAGAMVVTALCLRTAIGGSAAGDRRHAVWMLLCVLSKPPQLAFIVLARMLRPGSGPFRRLRSLVLIVMPAALASVLWALTSASDAGAWRLVELTGRAAQEFAPAWKLGFMLEHPWHFPKAVAGTLSGAGELWRQLIGVLGLFDTPLQPWTYPVISALLLATCLTPMALEGELKWRVVAVSALTVAGYAFAVFLILYIVWTPIDAAQVWGVQGRYFIPALPAFAIAAAALVKIGPRGGSHALLAISAAVLSGAASVEATLRGV